MDIEYLKLIVAVFIAVGGWAIAYLTAEAARRRANAAEARKREEAAAEEIRRQAREAEITHLNEQIREFYGPMYALLVSGEISWLAFRKIYSPKHGKASYFDSQSEILEEELLRWRVWMKEVFHPLNRAMEKLILDHVHLIEGSEIDDAFLKFLAHTKTYDGVIAQWELGDFERHTSIINFPDAEFRGIVVPKYKELVAKRQALMDIRDQDDVSSGA